MDLNVGVTVADGLLETSGLTFPSTNGLIGVVVVDAPTTLGKGAVRWLLVTGLTWPTTAAGVLFGVAIGVVGVGGTTGAAEESFEADEERVEVVCWLPDRATVSCGRSVTETEVSEVVLAVAPAENVDLTGTGAATKTGVAPAIVTIAAGDEAIPLEELIDVANADEVIVVVVLSPVAKLTTEVVVLLL